MTDSIYSSTTVITTNNVDNGKLVIYSADCCYIVLHIVIGILAIIFGSENVNEPCSTWSTLHMSTWLIVQGIVFICMSGAGPLRCFITSEMFNKFFAYIGPFYNLFELIWIILGFISLIGHSQSCIESNPKFYNNSLTILIFSIIMLVCGCCQVTRVVILKEANHQV